MTGLDPEQCPIWNRPTPFAPDGVTRDTVTRAASAGSHSWSFESVCRSGDREQVHKEASARSACQACPEANPHVSVFFSPLKSFYLPFAFVSIHTTIKCQASYSKLIGVII